MKRFLPSILLDIFNISIFTVLRNYNNNGPVSSSFIMSRGQHRQSGAIPFYSCCLWISVDRGAVNTSGEVSINKLRLTSFIEMLLYCILY